MKYSLMSLMVDEELRHEKPNMMMKAMLMGMGIADCPEDVDEVYALLNRYGVPMTNGTASFEDLVRFTKENGFDGLDLMSFQMECSGSKLRAILEKYDVVLSAVNIITPFSEANTEELFQEMLCRTKVELDQAIEAGTKKILLVPGSYMRGEGMTREQAFQTMMRGLHACVDYVRGRDVVITTETLESISVPWSSLGEMKRVFDAVPGLMYTHDTGNPLVAGEDPLSLCKELGGRMVSVHFKDLGLTEESDRTYRTMDGQYLRLVPSGTGEVDFAAHLKFLAECRYDGYITIEGGLPGENKWQEAVNALRYFRKLEERERLR